MKTEQRVLVIDRARWLTGEAQEHFGMGVGRLRDPQTGMMCCLGFACRALRIPAREISEEMMPRDLPKKYQGRISKHGLSDNEAPDRLAEINDWSVGIAERKHREAAIRRRFRTIGWKVSFTGRYPDYEKIREAKLGQD